MSSTPSPVSPIDGTENPYIVVINKRIRAYKKKIERINSLRGKESLNKEQMELCSHYDLYSTILTELLGIKEQLVAIQPSYSESPVDIPVEATPVDDCSMENPVNEEVEQVEEKPEQVEQVEEKPEQVVPGEMEETDAIPEVVEEVTEKPVEEVNVEEKKEEEKKVEKKGGKPRKFYHGRKEGGKRDENRPYNPRRERNYRRNGRQYRFEYYVMNRHGGRVTEDGWEIPKKVAYIKQDKL